MRIIAITVPSAVASVFSVAQIVFKYLFDYGKKKRLEDTILERLIYGAPNEGDLAGKPTSVAQDLPSKLEISPSAGEPK